MSTQVLYVTPEKSEFETAVEVLQSEGLTVITATGISQGAERLDTDRVDCVVSEYALDDATGLEFLDAVRRESPALPFILFTRHGDEMVASNAISAGVTDYLVNDGTADAYATLADRIERHIEQSRPGSGRHTAEKYVRFDEDTPAPAVIYDQSHEIAWANQSATDLLGFDTPDQLTDRSVFDFVAPEDRDAVEARLETVLESRDPVRPDEIALVDSEGNERYVVSVDVPVTHEGDVAGQACGHDVTEWRERERELRNQQELLEKVLESIDDVFYLLDEDGGMLRWNDSLCEVTGYSDGEIASMNALDFFEGQDKEDVREAVEEGFEAGSVRVESAYTTRDGERIPYEFVANAFTHPDGERVLCGIGRDITERRVRERELERYEDIITHLPIGVYRSSPGPEGTFLEANPALAEMFGAESVDELMAHTPADLYANPEERRAFAEELQETGLVVDEERLQRTLDGEELWTSVTAIRREENGDVHFDGIVRDVTEQKRYQHQIEALHDATRRLIEADTPREVATIAVEAAEELLGFPLPSVWYATDGELTLAANSEQHQQLLEEAGETSPTHSQGDQIWNLFEAGETVVRDPLKPGDVAVDIPIQSAVIVPLAEYGFLSCAARERGEFEDEDVTLVEVLGRNVTAVLDNLQREEDLRRYKRYTDDVLDAIDDVFYVLDREGNLQRWNQSFGEVTGYTDEEIASMNAADLFAQNEAKRVEGLVTEAFETGNIQAELSFKTSDGELVPYEFVANSLEAPDGSPVLVGIGRDITERRERERALREAEARLREAQQIAHVGHWNWDIETGRIDWSDEVYRIFGLEPDEIDATYERFLEFVHPDDRERVEGAVEGALSESGGDRVYSVDHRIVRPDGEVRIVHERAEVYAEDRDPVRMLGIVQDVTEERRLEKLLRLVGAVDSQILQAADEAAMLESTLELLTSVSEYDRAAIGLLDSDGTLTTLRHEESDDAVESGEAWMGLYTPEFVNEVLTAGARTIEDFDERFDGQSSTPVESEAIALPLRHGTVNYGILTLQLPSARLSKKARRLLEQVANDVAVGLYTLRTERRLGRQNEQLQLLNEIIRHDIRNNMQVVLGLGNALRDEVGSGEGSDLDIVLRNAEQVVDLTITMRELTEAMLESDPDGLSSLTLPRYLEPEIENARNISSNAVVQVETPIPDVDVRANEMLDAVFRNLLKNAIQHNDEDVPQIAVAVETDDEWVYVDVADNGPGVPDDQKEEIFGRGEKGLESSGTGLGLYLVDTLVTQYGGDVWVEDNDSKGSIFVVKLPRAEQSVVVDDDD